MYFQPLSLLSLVLSTVTAIYEISSDLEPEQFHYLDNHLTGTWYQPIENLNQPGSIPYISYLEFDQDLSFHKETNQKCNAEACTLSIPAPTKGRYAMRKLKSSDPKKKGFKLNLNSVEPDGSNESFNANFAKNGTVLKLVKDGEEVELLKKDVACDFPATVDICGENVGFNAVCARDHRCRVAGRFLTPCTEDSQCEVEAYKYYCDKVDKVCRFVRPATMKKEEKEATSS